MADIVPIIGVTHNGMMAEPDPEPAIEDHALMGKKLAEARPDALVVIANSQNQGTPLVYSNNCSIFALLFPRSNPYVPTWPLPRTEALE